MCPDFCFKFSGQKPTFRTMMLWSFLYIFNSVDNGFFYLQIQFFAEHTNWIYPNILLEIRFVFEFMNLVHKQNIKNIVLSIIVQILRTRESLMKCIKLNHIKRTFLLAENSTQSAWKFTNKVSIIDVIQQYENEVKLESYANSHCIWKFKKPLWKQEKKENKFSVRIN